MIKGNDDTRFGRRLETLFWWILRLAPVLYILFHAFADGSPMYDLYQAVEGFAGEILIGENIIFTTFERLFGYSGALPFWAAQDTPIYYYLTYLVFIEVVRVFINIFLFIIRLANNLFDRFVR